MSRRCLALRIPRGTRAELSDPAGRCGRSGAPAGSGRVVSRVVRARGRHVDLMRRRVSTTIPAGRSCSYITARGEAAFRASDVGAGGLPDPITAKPSRRLPISSSHRRSAIGSADVPGGGFRTSSAMSREMARASGGRGKMVTSRTVSPASGTTHCGIQIPHSGRERENQQHGQVAPYPTPAQAAAEAQGSLLVRRPAGRAAPGVLEAAASDRGWPCP